MSVANKITRSTRRSDYTATPGQTVFGPASGWRCFDAADVRVWARAAVGQRWQRVTSGYTASLSAPGLGFVTVTFAAGRNGGSQVRVEAARTHERETDVTRAGSLQTALFERELDKQSTILQEHRRDLDEGRADVDAQTDRIGAIEPKLADIDQRAVRVPPGEAAITLQPVAVRSSKPAVFGPGGALIGGDPVLTTADLIGTEFNTRLAASVAVLKPEQRYVRTVGYYNPGDGGGALWRVDDSEPAHQMKIPLAGGKWLAMAEFNPCLEAAGAVGDGVIDDTAAWNALRSYSSAFCGSPGKIYVLGDVAPGLRTYFDGKGCRLRKAPGATCAVNLSTTYATIKNCAFDQDCYLADGTLDPAKVATALVVSKPATNQLVVSDATPFKVGMVAAYEASGYAATATVSGRPREEANYINAVDLVTNTLTFEMPLYSAVKVGAKIAADFGMLRFGAGTFQPLVDNVVFQRCFCAIVTGDNNAAIGNAVPIFRAVRISNFVAVGIAQREGLGVEFFSDILIEGSHTVSKTTVAAAGQTVFTYGWNISPRIHRAGNLTVTRNGVAVGAGDFTIDDALGTFTLASPAAEGDVLLARNSEFAARGMYCAGVGGSVNSMGRMTNSAILGCAVGVECRGGTAGVEFMYGAGVTIDTCSYSCMLLHETKGLNLTGWSLLFAPYPLIIGTGTTNMRITPLDTSVMDSGSIHNIAAYPNRFAISVDPGVSNVRIPLDNWHDAGGTAFSCNVPERIIWTGHRHQTPHRSILTIAGGAITVTGSNHRVETEGAAATDDLTTINGPALDGMHLYLQANDSAHDVVVKNNAGNIRLSGSDFTLSTAVDVLHLMYHASRAEWHEVSRSDNA